MKLFKNYGSYIYGNGSIYTYLNITGVEVQIWFGYIGKLSAPIFFYLIVRVFFHTRSRVKYMKRLFNMVVLRIGAYLVLGIYFIMVEKV